MRRALGVALLAFAAVGAPAHAATLRTFAVHESVDAPVVVGNAAFYAGGPAHVLKRIDLVTGQTSRAFGRPRPYALGRFRAGGGRIAAEVYREAGLRSSSAIVEFDPAGAVPPRTVVRGKLRRQCGTEVTLQDVSPQGELLIDTETRSCGARPRDVHVLRRYGAGPPVEVARYPERRSDDDPAWRLIGSLLLQTTEAEVRVKDLTTGSVRRIRPTRRGSRIAYADADLAGNLAVGQVRFSRRSFHEVVRLVPPGGSLPSGRVLFDDRGIDTEPVFCGSRLIAHRLSSAGEQLLVYDDLAGRPRTAFSSTTPGVKTQDVWVACDAGTVVLSDIRGRSRSLVDVVPLTP